MHQQKPQTVLLVDGDVSRAQRLVHRLGGLGLDLKAISDGARALIYACEQRPSAIIIDAAAPILNGFLFIEAVRAQPATQDVPVILLTESNAPEELARGWTLGADLCVPRTGGEADVLATLHRALGTLRGGLAERRAQGAVFETAVN